jgi:hypothetical protein
MGPVIYGSILGREGKSQRKRGRERKNVTERERKRTRERQRERKNVRERARERRKLERETCVGKISLQELAMQGTWSRPADMMKKGTIFDRPGVRQQYTPQ